VRAAEQVPPHVDTFSYLAASRPLNQRSLEAGMPVRLMSAVIVAFSAVLNLPVFIAEHTIENCLQYVTDEHDSGNLYMGDLSIQISKRPFTDNSVYRTGT
jgi:hypothetical protein